MRCEELAADLSAYLDGECGPAERGRVSAHLEDCAACNETLLAWRQVSDRLRREGADAGVDTDADALAPMRSAVARELAWVSAERFRVVPPPKARPGVGLAWAPLVLAAGALLAAGFLFPVAHAEEEVRRIVDLEDRNRAEVIRQLVATDALRLEIAAAALRARAFGFDASQLATLDAEADALLAETHRLQDRLAELQTRMLREGLLAVPESDSDAPAPAAPRVRRATPR